MGLCEWSVKYPDSDDRLSEFSDNKQPRSLHES